MTGFELLETLSSNIRSFRKQRSWTQEMLAEEAEMSVQAINFFECRRRWPGEESLSKIASALGVEVYQLFIPKDTKTVTIEATPENEIIRAQITEEVLNTVENSLKRTMEKLRKEN